MCAGYMYTGTHLVGLEIESLRAAVVVTSGDATSVNDR